MGGEDQSLATSHLMWVLLRPLQQHVFIRCVCEIRCTAALEAKGRKDEQAVMNN